MQLNRVIVEWQGAPVVGNAVSVLHFAGDVGAPNPAAIKTAFTTVAQMLPSNVTLTIPNGGDVIEDTNGHLVNSWAGTGGGTVSGGAPTGCAAGTGACVTWDTGAIVRGRRLRGRTFIVPINSTSYDVDGKILGTRITILTNFASQLMASGPLAVWHRPTTVGGVDGTSSGVTLARIKPRVAVLTSRRD